MGREIRVVFSDPVFTKSGIAGLGKLESGARTEKGSSALPVSSDTLQPAISALGAHELDVARASAAASPFSGASAGAAWVRDSARSTIPSNIGIKESAGRG